GTRLGLPSPWRPGGCVGAIVPKARSRLFAPTWSRPAPSRLRILFRWRSPWRGVRDYPEHLLTLILVLTGPMRRPGVVRLVLLPAVESDFLLVGNKRQQHLALLASELAPSFYPTRVGD